MSAMKTRRCPRITVCSGTQQRLAWQDTGGLKAYICTTCGQLSYVPVVGYYDQDPEPIGWYILRDGSDYREQGLQENDWRL